MWVYFNISRIRLRASQASELLQKVEQTGITVCNLASDLLQKVGQAGITVPAKLPIVGRAKKILLLYLHRQNLFH